MTKRRKNSQGTTAQIAGRMLMAWKSGDDLKLREEFTRITSFNLRGLSGLEQERMDLLGGIAQALCATEVNPNQIRAAVQLLEHLDSRN